MYFELSEEILCENDLVDKSNQHLTNSMLVVWRVDQDDGYSGISNLATIDI